ncbi:MAG: UDP-N-acetylglucosamine 1-carboxyvinyltransferase [Clostridia bacterium]|nr:UDP-N-acetylglucosamine 1-carboxyvinyltransferase [Clostridia bacterium]
MSKIAICGGQKLNGEIMVQGSKNAALPILAATVLSDEECVLFNCPDLEDVRAALKIIDWLGGDTEYSKHTATISGGNIHRYKIPEELMNSMRSSVLFLGPMLAKLKRAEISYPGGCSIGLRPIDLHIKAFRQLGVTVEEIGGRIYCSAEKIKPCKVNLLFPSVGATENIMLLCALSDGETQILNAAREPEIVDLQNFLNSMGAKISGAGSETIHIIGVEKLQKVQYNIMSDRIFATTVLCAVACCGGDVILRNINPNHIELMLSMLAGAGCNIITGENYVRIRCSKRLLGLGKVMTSPYPGFPTDAQALFMSALSGAEGTTVFVENIFESRYKHVPELIKMGADIIVDGRLAAVTGCNYLQGATVEAQDLRGGAALVIAGLSAIGDTVIGGIRHIDRGYEHIEETFKGLGANIRRI